MNISKEKSREIAELLMAKKREQHEKLKNAFSSVVRKEYMKTLPEEVVSVFNKYPKYIEQSSSVTLIGNGFSHEYISTERVPAESNGWRNANLSPDKELGAKLVKQFNEMLNVEKEYKDGVSKVSATLFALRTHNRIKDQFPEAEPHLPPAETKMELMNISEVRKLVK